MGNSNDCVNCKDVCYPPERAMRRKGTWEVFVKTPQNKIIRLDKAHPELQIRDLKRRYEKQLGEPAESTALTLNGSPLNNNQTLSEAGVSDHMTLFDARTQESHSLPSGLLLTGSCENPGCE